MEFKAGWNAFINDSNVSYPPVLIAGYNDKQYEDFINGWYSANYEMQENGEVSELI